jgi:type VI secretion system protein ImpJ
MGDNTRVAWTEGMFLRPQHFQQADKYISNVIKQVCSGNLAFVFDFPKTSN